MNEKKSLAKRFINEHPLAVISINRKGKAPYAASIFIACDDALNLFFITKSETEKYKAIAKDNKVSITITDFELQQTIQAEGEANQITAEGGVTEELFKKLASIKPKGNNNWLPPIVKLQSGNYSIFEINLSKMRYADFKQELNLRPDNIFTDII